MNAEPTDEDYALGAAHMEAESVVRGIRYKMAMKRGELASLEHELRAACAEEARLHSLIAKWEEDGDEEEEEEEDE